MSWKDKYHRINSTSDGDLIIFGVHCTLDEAKEILKEDEWDDDKYIEEFDTVHQGYIHFGLVHIDDETTSGWTFHEGKQKSMKGKIKATIVYESFESKKKRSAEKQQEVNNGKKQT